MAVMLVFHAPEMTLEQYDALRPIVQWEQDAPAGLLLHVCGFADGDGVRVCDVWESEGDMKAFFETRLGPAFAQVGVNAPPPKMLPVHNLDAFPGIAAHTP